MQPVLHKMLFKTEIPDAYPKDNPAQGAATIQW